MKSNLDKHFKTNPDFDESGVWFNIGDETGPGFRVRPFKASNTHIKSATAKYFKPYAKQIEMGTLPEGKAREINIKLFIEACLITWRHVEIDGKEAEYSPEAAFKLFKELPELFSTLFSYCQDFKNYLDDDLGNSSAAE